MTQLLIHRDPGKKPNDWQLTYGEYVEAIGMARTASGGSAFFDTLYASRFDTASPLDDGSKIEPCRDVADACYGGSSDKWIKTQCDAIRAASTVDAATTALHDLFRGFTDAEHTAAVSNAPNRRSGVIARADQAIQYNTTAAGRAGVHQNDAQKHRDNVATLTDLKTKVQAQTAEGIASGELSEVAARRHMPSLAGFLRFAPLTNEDWVIDGCDAARVSFPFRFLIHAPLRAYHGLLQEWKSTGDAAAVTAKIAAEVFTEQYADTLLALFKETPMAKAVGATQIEGVIKEMSDALANRRLQTVTLLAVTQAEGMIWRYAAILNQTATPVYVERPRTPPQQGVEKFGYRWDRKQVRPMLDNAGNRLETPKPLTSAYALLKQTQMEQAFRPNAVDFILSDYTNDRNVLAHGTLVADERLAVQAALLFGTVMQCITEFEAEGRPLRTL